MSDEEEMPFLRDLCREFMGYTRGAPYRDVLLPWLPDLRRVLATLDTQRRLNTTEDEYPVPYHDLHQWYALSHLNDCLIVNFQHDTDFYGASLAQVDTYPAVPPEQYLEFFLATGFEPFDRPPYNPFHHEIAEVVEDTNFSGEPLVEGVFWPGWMFGEMLFARAGVRVRCSPGTFDKQIAENSRMYFAYRWERRKASDLSHGWGSNSQWSTSFRRDYDSGDAYHFNVDGTHPLGDESLYKASFSPGRWKMQLEAEAELGGDPLTMEERIELLVNRCFVHCRKSDEDRWPFDDKYTLPHWTRPVTRE